MFFFPPLSGIYHQSPKGGVTREQLAGKPGASLYGNNVQHILLKGTMVWNCVFVPGDSAL